MRAVYVRILRVAFASIVTAWVGHEMQKWARS